MNYSSSAFQLPNAFSGEWVCWNGVHLHGVHFYYSSHRARIQYQLMSHQSDSTQLNIWLKFCSRPASFLWIFNAINLPIHTRTVGAMQLSTYFNSFLMSQIIIDPFQEIISQHLSDINFLMRLLLRPQLQILCRFVRVGVFGRNRRLHASCDDVGSYEVNLSITLTRICG